MAVNPINALPESGHRHLMVPYNELQRPDGIYQVWSRCPCGMEERRSFSTVADPPRPIRVEYRLTGGWMTALDLIRRRDLPVEECQACEGAGCEACAGLGVVERLGGPVAMPKLAPPSEPARAGWYDPAQDRIVPLKADDGLGP